MPTSIDEIKQGREHGDQLLHLREKRKELEREVEKLKADIGEQKELQSAIVGAIQAADPFTRVPCKAGTKTESGVVAVFEWGDWHTGENTKPSQIEHVNAYGWNIQQKRINLITDDFLNWIETQRHGYRIDRVNVFGMADWISGDIHYELTATNDHL